jgi:hypothetical protein
MSAAVKWTGKRIKALTLYKEVNSDSFLPTRGFLSREHLPFFLLYAWALHLVSFCLDTPNEQFNSNCMFLCKTW